MQQGKGWCCPSTEDTPQGSPNQPISTNSNSPCGLVSTKGRNLGTNPNVEGVFSSRAIPGVGPEARIQSATKQRSKPPATCRSSHGGMMPGHTQMTVPSHPPCQMPPSPVGPQVPSITRGLPQPPAPCYPPSMPGHHSPTINTANGSGNTTLNIQSFKCKGYKSSFYCVFYLLGSRDGC